MDLTQSNRRPSAFTLVELLVVIAIIGLLAALLLPAVNRSQMRAKRVWCENNLQQQGIAFQSFAHDHNSKFPTQVSVSDGGALEFVQDGYLVNGQFFFAFHIFQTLSNELVTPNLLICPTDTRVPAEKFSGLQNANVSYFADVNADYFKPTSILSGDRNLATNTFSNPSILHDETGFHLLWTRELHEFKGNVLFADGHVEEWNDNLLSSGANVAGEVNDLFMPSVKSGAQTPYAQPLSAAASSPPQYSRDFSPSQSNSPNANLPPSSAPPPGNEPANQPKFSLPTAASNDRQKIGAAALAQAGGQISNDASENALAAINPPTTETTVTNNDDSGMSPSNQKAASFLRCLFGWLFLLILLLLLLDLWWRTRGKRTNFRTGAGSEE
jgi:prepilin-type N-terminal cleavage/methylation domain-containing protein/prepilin-type processing-associated H-X9-DG protein